MSGIAHAVSEIDKLHSIYLGGNQIRDIPKEGERLISFGRCAECGKEKTRCRILFDFSGRKPVCKPVSYCAECKEKMTPT